MSYDTNYTASRRVKRPDTPDSDKEAAAKILAAIADKPVLRLTTERINRSNPVNKFSKKAEARNRVPHTW